MTDRKWWDLWWDWRAELEPSTPWSALERSAARRRGARDLFLSFVDTVRNDAPCCTSKVISSSAPRATVTVSGTAPKIPNVWNQSNYGTSDGDSLQQTVT
jgi:hypothetical protein